MKSAIAENTKKIIKKSGYKQKAIGLMAGYEPKVFNNMLNGRRIISDVDIVAIAKALNVTPNELFDTQPHHTQ